MKEANDRKRSSRESDAARKREEELERQREKNNRQHALDQEEANKLKNIFDLNKLQAAIDSLQIPIPEDLSRFYDLSEAQKVPPITACEHIDTLKFMLSTLNIWQLKSSFSNVLRAELGLVANGMDVYVIVGNEVETTKEDLIDKLLLCCKLQRIRDDKEAMEKKKNDAINSKKSALSSVYDLDKLQKSVDTMEKMTHPDNGENSTAQKTPPLTTCQNEQTLEFVMGTLMDWQLKSAFTLMVSEDVRHSLGSELEESMPLQVIVGNPLQYAAIAKEDAGKMLRERCRWDVIDGRYHFDCNV